MITKVFGAIDIIAGLIILFADVHIVLKAITIPILFYKGVISFF